MLLRLSSRASPCPLSSTFPWALWEFSQVSSKYTFFPFHLSLPADVSALCLS